MRLIKHLLLTAGVCWGAIRDTPYAARIDSNRDDVIVAPSQNRGGWVNPEDLTSMPQCIAQQDQSAWLGAMTRCTSKRCTRHFGIICTRHEWLIELDCLGREFSPDVIRGYLQYCGRAVLAKAQLYHWIRDNARRTWLVDVGDANELQYLSPVSLTDGYAAIDVINKAPTCLTDSTSSSPVEPFQRILSSCSFCSTTEHMGNPARPWEYNEGVHSIMPLDYETVGYDLTGGHISDGDYFDKRCFCRTFTMEPSKEPCSGPGLLDLTKERLWINAICGPSSLPDEWRDGLITTEFAYIAVRNWYWPTCVNDMPKYLIELPDQCTADTCELDSYGFCRVVRAVDRTCFCRQIRYDSCGGSCHFFETRFEFVQWLHNLCGNVRDWDGLPENWRQLTVPTLAELLPWEWTLKHGNVSDATPISRLELTKATETCAATDWKIRSAFLVALAGFAAGLLAWRKYIEQPTRWPSYDLLPRHWFSKGVMVAALQIFANGLNAFLVQNIRGYEETLVYDLVLFWCLMPRFTWLTTLTFGARSCKGTKSTVAALLLSEAILQLLSWYYMLMTVIYGLEHSFYFGGLDGAERAMQAKFLYAGALLWLAVVIVLVALLVRAVGEKDQSAGDDDLGISRHPTSKQKTPNLVEDLMTYFNELQAELEERRAECWIDKSANLNYTPLLRGERDRFTTYGTLPSGIRTVHKPQDAFVRIFPRAVLSMLLLWMAQWLFWKGLVGLSLGNFCLPEMGILTAVWLVSLLAGTTVATF